MKFILKEWFGVLLGTCIVAIGLKYFIFPMQLNQAGISGIALAIAKFFRENPNALININLFNFWFIALNVPIIIWAAFKLDTKIIIYTLLYTLVLPIALKVLPDISLMNIESNKLLAAIIGSWILGVGFSLPLKSGGSSGGTDLIFINATKKDPKKEIAKLTLYSSIAIALLGQLSQTIKFKINFFDEKLFYTIVSFTILKATLSFYFPRHNILKLSIITKDFKGVKKIIAELLPHKTYSSTDVCGSKDKNKKIDIVLSYYESIELVNLLEERKIASFTYSHMISHVYGTFRSVK